ncbi:universal stress protein [Dyadobacter psychrotolerans]|uniref:Universal stress protein n=1 Tax=Dyadobacter psychrotolerans TaxID=2541721 RepID=A0A4R5D449_9BACT|nr:universal stress protein [Dyadobacter psychrotolerans]TDE08169.1 universal stress protein [Dyadobacter psychrotolerans]
MPIYKEMEDDYRTKLHDRVSQTLLEGYPADAVWETDGIETAVLRQANKASADLIVVGRTGSGKFWDKLIGSSATGIAINASCPVLIIPPNHKVSQFENIVYATQLEFDETDIISEVIDLVKQLEGKLRLVKVNSDWEPDIQPDRQFIKQIENELNMNQKDIVILNGNQVMHALEDYSDKISADLLIVSTRQRGFLDKLFDPGMTKKLIVDTHVPLLVYHQKSHKNQYNAPLVIL